MDSIDERNRIRFNDNELNSHIYRIYAIDRLESLFRSQTDALVNPKKWDDPFENFFLARTNVVDSLTRNHIPLSNLANDWYGQCWSRNRETDAMWRIYSPDPMNQAGAKVRTTIRRLFDNLSSVNSTAPNLQFFVGRVDYWSQQKIQTQMSRLSFSDLALGATGEHFANLLCIKREAFRHENEVRLLFQYINGYGQKIGTNGVFSYPLKPNNIFDEVVLDPRLSDSQAQALTLRLETAGCTLSITKSDLYQSPEFVIPL